MGTRRKAIGLSVAVVAMMGVVCPGVRGLNPALDVSQYAHKAWKIREGFTNGAITSIAQTRDGYLWLGTEFGLLRFDGVRNVAWSPPAGQQLPDNNIRNLLAANDGTLWIGTYKGLASWKDGKLIQHPEFAGQTVDLLFEDHEGEIWVGTNAVTFGKICTIRDGRTQCSGQDGSFGQFVASLYEDRQHNIWAASANGLWKCKPGPLKQYPMPDSTSFTWQTLAEDDEGALLIATRGGVKRFVNGKTEPYLLPRIRRGMKPNMLFRDRQGSLWISTFGGGLFHLHEGRTDAFSQADGLSGNDPYRVFEDREGIIWVVTDGGLDRFRDLAAPTFSVNQSLPSNVAWSVLAAKDGSLWIGSAGGLAHWKEKQFTIYQKPGARAVAADLGRERDGAVRRITDSGLPNGVAQSVAQDRKGRIWVTTPAGVAYFEKEQFISINDVPTGTSYSLVEDNAGDFWVNHNQGLLHLADKKIVETIPWTKFGRRGIAISLVADRSNGGVWLGFFDGGLVYFRDGRVLASYSAADGLGKGHVTDLRFGSRGTLWAATEGGLSRIRDGRILTLMSKNGLPCDMVHWSIEDNDHFVWASMACGLVRIARSELDAWVNDPNRRVKATVFDSADGVRNHALFGGYRPQVTKSADGRIWFLPWDGVAVVDPRHLPHNELPPPVQIEQVTADHKTYDAASVANEKLPALLRELEIDYTALSFVAPEKVRFRIKLEGWDSDWQDVGNRRQAFYGNLPPRHYRFRVLACNNSGVWNETGASLDFSIAPAYYQTSWFAFLCAGGFLGLLWAAYQMRLQQVTVQVRQRMEGRLEERERIARDLHDTLLQSVQGLILKFHAVSKQCDEQVRQTIEKTLDHADEVMAEGRDRVRNLRATSVSLADLPAAFRRVADETAPGREATFKVVVEGKARELNPMILEESFSIGREALINALVHSGGRNVEVEITYDARQFRLRINDDGRGVDPEVLEKGGRAGHWGLPGMRERARKMGAQLEFWSRPGTGTEIELRIPGATAYSASGVASKGFWFGRALDRLRGRYE